MAFGSVYSSLIIIMEIGLYSKLSHGVAMVRLAPVHQVVESWIDQQWCGCPWAWTVWSMESTRFLSAASWALTLRSMTCESSVP